MRYSARSCQGIVSDGSNLGWRQWDLPGLARLDMAARACPPQPGPGQAGRQPGQTQPWASGTSLVMGTEH